MNNNNRQSSRGSGLVTVLILVGVLLYNLFAGKFNQEDMSIVIASTIFVAFIMVIVIAVSMAKGRKGAGKKQTISLLSRATQGVRIMRLIEGSRVISIECTERAVSEDTAEDEAESDAGNGKQKNNFTSLWKKGGVTK